MGIPWGIERSTEEYNSKEEYLNIWKNFCKSGCCKEFVIPFDETFYHFRLENDNVSIIESKNKVVMSIMNKLTCSDGTYDEFTPLIGLCDLYLPDDHGERKIPSGILPWEYQWASSITKLLDLSTHGSELERELRTAADFCYNYGMIISFSWG